MGNRIIAVATLVVAAIYFYGIRQIEVPSIEDILGPRTFPTMIGIGLVIAAGMLLFESRTARARPVQPAPAEADSGEVAPNIPLLAAVVVATFLYIFLFERLGYILSTAAYLVALTLYFHPRNKPAAVLTSVAFALVSYFTFNKLLGVQLPRGLISFF